MHQFGAGTHVGNIRDNNEDSYVCDLEKELWIVADGMGGLGFGEVASAIATSTVTQLIREGHGVNQAIEVAHARIKEYGEVEGMGTNMGTTIVLLLSQGSLYNIFWVGDSRAYLLDTNSFKQVTVDHSLVQSLIEQGELTVEQAASDPRKNAVTKALGVQELESVRADSISDKWKPGQKILLCSDGLTDCVDNSNIEAILRRDGTDQELSTALIEAALEGGGKDNVTVVLISAPDTTRFSDSDTHVPANLRSDDTHVPQSEAIKPAGGTRMKSSSSHVQLPTGKTAITDSVQASETDTTSGSWIKLWQRLFKHTHTLAVLIFFLGLTNLIAPTLLTDHSPQLLSSRDSFIYNAEREIRINPIRWRGVT